MEFTTLLHGVEQSLGGIRVTSPTCIKICYRVGIDFRQEHVKKTGEKYRVEAPKSLAGIMHTVRSNPAVHPVTGKRQWLHH